MTMSNQTQALLTIADVHIAITSRSPMEALEQRADERFGNFLGHRRRSGRPDVHLEVRIVRHLPAPGSARDLFVTTHFQDGSENWRLQQRDGQYLFRCPLEDKEQVAIVSRSFDRAAIYVLPKSDGRWVWALGDIIYDFLQILLINYLALRGGVFVHGIGVKDVDGRGLLFVGKSGAGKSTTARFWHRHSRAMILNDDRIIVRKRGKRFVMYGTPWHGDFSDYLASAITPAPLERLCFIHHAPRHVMRPITAAQAFCELYPCLFPTFWDRRGLERTASLCQELIGSVPVARLGFRKDRSVIAFVRQRCR